MAPRSMSGALPDPAPLVVEVPDPRDVEALRGLPNAVLLRILALAPAGEPSRAVVAVLLERGFTLGEWSC